MNCFKLISIISFTGFLIGQPTGTALAQNEGFSVCPRGLRVVAIPRAGETGFRPFNYSAGTTVVVQIETNDSFIVDYDRNSNQITKYVDNVGTDLQGNRRGRKFNDTKIGNVNYSKDRHAALVELPASGVPDTTANSVHIEAEITFMIARKKATHRRENVPLVSDQKIEMGDSYLTIVKAGPPESGNRPLAVELKTDSGLTNFETVRFFDISGNEIKNRRVSWSRGGIESAASAEFHLWQKLEMATIELNQWQEVEAIKIPIQVDCSIGLSEYGLIESTLLKAELHKLITENIAAEGGADPPDPNVVQLDTKVDEVISEMRIDAPDFLRVYPEVELRFEKGEFDTEATRARWKSLIESSKVAQANFDLELPTLLKALVAQNDTRPLVGIRLELATQLLEAEGAKWTKRLWDGIEKE